jgi:hypothetical protein
MRQGKRCVMENVLEWKRDIGFFPALCCLVTDGFIALLHAAAWLRKKAYDLVFSLLKGLLVACFWTVIVIAVLDCLRYIFGGK